MTEVLTLAAVSKRFGNLLANDSISLSLARGEVLGILGENGAGKTTLMNVIFGHYTADDGHIEVDGRKLPAGSPEAAIKAGIGMVHQHFTLADNLTVLENVVLGRESLLSFRQKLSAGRNRLQILANQFGLDVNPDARVGDLTVGERQRVEILKTLFADARILILDEPTAVLTPQETENLFRTLRRFVGEGLSVVLISHKLHEIIEICNRIAVLRRGKLIAIVPAEGADRATLAELMVGRSVTRPKAEPLEPGSRVFALSGVSTSTGVNDLEDVSIVVHEHEIVGIVGVSGNGQRALAGIACGTVSANAGTVKLLGDEVARVELNGASAAAIGRIPEDRHLEGVVGEMEVWENLVCEDIRSKSFSQRGILDKQACVHHANDLIDQFNIRCSGPNAETRLLSGGNVQRLILARVFSRSPKFIVANQPTRGLDEGAIAFVHKKLLEARRSGAGILLISEDLDELLELADRLLVLFRGRLRPVQSSNPTEIGLMMSGQGMGA